MTPEIGLEIARVRMEVYAQQILVRALYIALANASPNGGQLLREQFADLRERHQKLTLKGTDPAMSDMMAGEWQQILDEALSHIETGLKPQP